MSEKYKFSDPQGMYFVTMTVVDWIDLFTRNELKNIVIDSLKYCQFSKGLVIHAWCMMPSHLHMIISTDKEPLSCILRDFKKFTSKKLIDALNLINESRKAWILEKFKDAGESLKRVTNYKVWQDGNHPELLFSKDFVRQKLDYIHNNPLEAQIVDEPEWYLYSSARDYYETRKGLIALRKIE